MRDLYWKVRRPEVFDRDRESRTGQAALQIVKSAKPNDLVFQSVKDGKPMHDNNVLVQFIKPAARKLGISCELALLRTCYATWLIRAPNNGNPRVRDDSLRIGRSRFET